VALCFALGSAGAAPTRDDQRRAAESFRQAEAAFGRKEYAAAAAAFEQAGRFVPHPKAFLNAAEAWDLAGEPVRSAEACARALELPVEDNALHVEARTRLEALFPRIARIEIAGAGRLRARIDGGEEIAPPAARYVSSGKHRVDVVDPEDGSVRTLEVDARAGATERLDLSPKAAPIPEGPKDVAPPTTPPAPERPPVPVGTWVSFGVAGAAATAMAVMGGLTLDAQSRFNDEPTREHADTFNAYRLSTNVLIGVAGAAALTGAIIWIIDAATAPAPVALHPIVGPGHAGFGVGARF
jgi:hypothetical protein